MHTHSINIVHNSNAHAVSLLGFLTLPKAATALAGLLSTGGLAGQHAWQLGWHKNTPHTAHSTQHTVSNINTSSSSDMQPSIACTLAVLACPAQLCTTRTASAAAASDSLPGTPITTAAAPFGALSPRHFGCVVSRGCIANAIHAAADAYASDRPNSKKRHHDDPKQQHCSGRAKQGALVQEVASAQQVALVLLDLRMHPGMEGAPVISPQGTLLGLLAPPLKQPSVAVEICMALAFEPVVVALHAWQGASGLKPVAGADGCHKEHSSSAAAATVSSSTVSAASSASLIRHSQQPQHDIQQTQGAVFSVQKATKSVLGIVTPSDRWASGIAMENGYILTVAHLFGDARGAAEMVQSQTPLRVCFWVDDDGGGDGSARVVWRHAVACYAFQGMWCMLHHSVRFECVLDVLYCWDFTGAHSSQETKRTNGNTHCPLYLAHRNTRPCNSSLAPTA